MPGLPRLSIQINISGRMSRFVMSRRLGGGNTAERIILSAVTQPARTHLAPTGNEYVYKYPFNLLVKLFPACDHSDLTGSPPTGGGGSEVLNQAANSILLSLLKSRLHHHFFIRNIYASSERGQYLFPNSNSLFHPIPCSLASTPFCIPPHSLRRGILRRKLAFLSAPCNTHRLLSPVGQCAFSV